MSFEQPQPAVPEPERGKKESLKNKIKKAIGIGAVAAAVLGAEGRAPKNAETAGAGDSGQSNASSEQFSGYGVETETKDGKIIKTGFGEQKENKTKFSGYGVSTETEDGEVVKSPYGEKKGSSKKFRGYGIGN